VHDVTRYSLESEHDRLSQRRYLGKPAAERIAERRRRLLDVALDELASEAGWRDVTIGRICSESGLNKRYFYESFDDLDQLARAVVDELAGELLTTGRDAAAAGLAEGLDTLALARKVVAATVSWLVADSRRIRALFSTSTGHPTVRANRRETVAALTAGLVKFAYGYHGSSGAPADAARVESIARVGSAMLLGGTAEAVLGWVESPGNVGFDALVDDLAELWVTIGDRAVALATRPRTRPAEG
jgi:AcrR family transcriptional regulator